jgi:FKBP-type peptidyl-prolyl cis-trans isomerase SlyD
MSDNIISKGKAVHFTYSITTDDDGNVMEQSDIPIGYVHGGYSELIDKVEAALEGCKVDDRLDVPLSPSESLWAYDPSLTFTDDLKNVPEQFHQIGAQVEMANEGGETKTFLVTEIKDGKLTVDGNHPLAGKAITFHVTVKTIRDATPEEIKKGRPADDLPEGMLH